MVWGLFTIWKGMPQNMAARVALNKRRTSGYRILSNQEGVKRVAVPKPSLSRASPYFCVVSIRGVYVTDSVCVPTCSWITIECNLCLWLECSNISDIMYIIIVLLFLMDGGQVYKMVINRSWTDFSSTWYKHITVTSINNWSIAMHYTSSLT